MLMEDNPTTDNSRQFLCVKQRAERRPYVPTTHSVALCTRLTKHTICANVITQIGANCPMCVLVCASQSDHDLPLHGLLVHG